jgi:hypothetical protein
MLSADAATADAADADIAPTGCGGYGDMMVLMMLCNGAHSRSILAAFSIIVIIATTCRMGQWLGAHSQNMWSADLSEPDI